MSKMKYRIATMIGLSLVVVVWLVAVVVQMWAQQNQVTTSPVIAPVSSLPQMIGTAYPPGATKPAEQVFIQPDNNSFQLTGMPTMTNGVRRMLLSVKFPPPPVIPPPTQEIIFQNNNPPLNFSQVTPITMVIANGAITKDEAGNVLVVNAKCLYFQTQVGVLGPFCSNVLPSESSGMMFQTRQVEPPLSGDVCFMGDWAVDRADAVGQKYYYRCLPDVVNVPTQSKWYRTQIESGW